MLIYILLDGCLYIFRFYFLQRKKYRSPRSRPNLDWKPIWTRNKVLQKRFIRRVSDLFRHFMTLKYLLSSLFKFQTKLKLKSRLFLLFWTLIIWISNTQIQNHSEWLYFTFRTTEFKPKGSCAWNTSPRINYLIVIWYKFKDPDVIEIKISFLYLVFQLDNVLIA